jgi:hypothetical protein
MRERQALSSPCLYTVLKPISSLVNATMSHSLIAYDYNLSLSSWQAKRLDNAYPVIYIYLRRISFDKVRRSLPHRRKNQKR